ncbi:MAG: hypothetical protein KKE23_02910 [Nanoarchaeota archaeon]|nr:hypothetical protein [Nanoarchaeota archaeon]
MLKIKINGNGYDLNGLKGYLKGFSELYLLEPLGRGNMSYFLMHKKNQRYDLSYIIKKIKSLNMDSCEKEWLRNLMKLQDRLNSFDEKEYFSLKKEKRPVYSTKYAFECAKVLEQLVEGYVNPDDELCPASRRASKQATWERWKDIISPINYLVRCSRTILAKNKLGIRTPLDLNILSE